MVQGKRFRFAASASPTLFAFFPGFGLASRIRHSFSPSINWNYSPAANVPEEYARAIVEPGQTVQLRSDATQTVSLGLSQTFEAKAKTRLGDTAAVDPRKFRVLSINTSPVIYDLEQAKKPGRTGWVTETMTNSFLSDLIPQFTLSLTHDLWAGVAGSRYLRLRSLSQQRQRQLCDLGEYATEPGFDLWAGTEAGTPGGLR